MPLTYTNNLIKRFRADTAVFSDAGGTTPAPVGGHVARLNNMAAPGGQIGIAHPTELVLRQDSADDGGLPYFTNDTTHFAFQGGDLIVVPDGGLTVPFTTGAVVRLGANFTSEPVPFDFGGYDQDTAVFFLGSDVCLRVFNQNTTYLPPDLFQFITLSVNTAKQATLRVNGAIAAQFDATSYDLSRFLIGVNGLRHYEGLVWTEAESPALLSSLSSYVKEYYKVRPTFLVAGNSRLAAAGAGVSNPVQMSSKRAADTFRALLRSVGADLNYVNFAAQGQQSPDTVIAVTNASAKGSPWFGPSVLVGSECTNDQFYHGTTDPAFIANRFLAIAAPAKAIQGTPKTLAITPPYRDGSPDYWDALVADVLANTLNGNPAFDGTIDISDTPAGKMRNAYSLTGIFYEMLMDAIHQNDNEQSLVADRIAPAVFPSLASFLYGPQVAALMAKKPTLTGLVLSPDRLSALATYDMPIQYRNSNAVGMKSDGTIGSVPMSASNFANEKRTEGGVANPIPYYDEYKQASGWTLGGSGLGAVTVTSAITPQNASNTLLLTFSAPMPPDGSGPVNVNYAETGNIRNHLGNSAAAYSVQIVAGPTVSTSPIKARLVTALSADTFYAALASGSTFAYVRSRSCGSRFDLIAADGQTVVATLHARVNADNSLTVLNVLRPSGGTSSSLNQRMPLPTGPDPLKASVLAALAADTFRNALADGSGFASARVVSPGRYELLASDGKAVVAVVKATENSDGSLVIQNVSRS